LEVPHGGLGSRSEAAVDRPWRLARAKQLSLERSHSRQAIGMAVTSTDSHQPCRWPLWFALGKGGPGTGDQQQHPDEGQR
jgi:hypothetical protein